MANLAIIGGGQIGSRHLQALSLLEGQHNIFVIDPSAESLEIARTRFEQVGGGSKSNLTLRLGSTFGILPNILDVAIVATNSGPRRKAIVELLERIEVKHLILEKVLFPNLVDYDWAEQRLSGVSVYVNCPLRMTDWPQFLKPKYMDCQRVVLTATGSNLGLACNAIHYIDLFNFLTGKSLVSIGVESLEHRVVRSKRAGFYEIYGQLICDFGEGNYLSLNSIESGELPCVMELVSEKSRDHICYDRSNSGTLRSSDQINNWTWRERFFEHPMQSQLTHLVVEDLLTRGTCALTPLKTSIELHRPLVSGLTSFFGRFQMERSSDCPIT